MRWQVRLKPDTTCIHRQFTPGPRRLKPARYNCQGTALQLAGIDRSVVVVDRRRPATHADTFFFEPSEVILRREFAPRDP